MNSSASRTAHRFSVVLPEAAPLAPPSSTPFNYLRPSIAVSLDGSQIVYTSKKREGGTQLYLRRADDYIPKPIPGTEGGFDPFLSPDAQWVGFFTFDSLLKVSLKGGAPLTLATVVNPVGGTWCDNGTIYFSSDEGDFLWSIPAAGAGGGQPALRVRLDADVDHNFYPQCLPGGSGLLLSMGGANGAARQARRNTSLGAPLSADYAEVGVLPLPLREHRPRPLIARGYAPQYAASGHIVFARGGNLVAAPFDLGQLRVTGPEAAVLNDVSMCSVSLAAAQFTMTRDGSLLYVPGGDQGRTQLVWVDRKGHIEPTAVAPNLFGMFNLSPDGKRAAVEVGGIQNDVYVYDLRDGRRVRITSDGRGGSRVLWHPDGRRVVFHSQADDRWVIQQVESDSGPEPLAVGEELVSSWSAGGLLAGVRQGRIWVGSLEQHTTITSAGREWGPVVSPDGALVAYTSARTGTYQVFAQRNPPTGQEWQISSDFGEEPIWSRNSHELFFRRHNQWWSVSFIGGAPGQPQLLFEGRFFNAFGPSYDVATDGRFLMALPPAATDSPRELLWIQDWTRDLAPKGLSAR
jgi:serine/threonine-protein kinase